MKTYNKYSTVRKPMMYGGVAKRRKVMNVGGIATSMPMVAPMGEGMMQDKMRKAKTLNTMNTPTPNVNMSAAMKRGGRVKKRIY